MHTPRAVAAALGVAALLLPAASRAHGVRHEVDLRDGAVAVRALHHGGRPLAGARYEVFAPGEAGRAHDEGRTDRHGWAVFVPDAPGAWRVRIADEAGHGKVIEVEVPPAAIAPAEGGEAPATAARGGPVRPAADARPGPGSAPGATDREGDPGPLRVAGGAAAIAIAFGVLFAVRRRRAAGR